MVLASALASRVVQAATSADAHQLASGAGEAARSAHPILMGLVHIVFVIIMVSFAAIVLTTLSNPRQRR